MLDNGAFFLDEDVRPFPMVRYADPARFGAERAGLFRSVPRVALHGSELSGPGAFRTVATAAARRGEDRAVRHRQGPIRARHHASNSATLAQCASGLSARMSWALAVGAQETPTAMAPAARAARVSPTVSPT